MDRKSKMGIQKKIILQYVEHSSSTCCVTLYIYITGDMVEFLCVTLRILYYISSYKYEFSQNVPSLDQYEAPSPVATACQKVCLWRYRSRIEAWVLLSYSTVRGAQFFNVLCDTIYITGDNMVDFLCFMYLCIIFIENNCWKMWDFVASEAIFT